MTWFSLVSTYSRSSCDVLGGQGTDLCLQRPDGPVVDEGVDVVLARSPLAAPLDAEPKETEPLAHVRHAGLGLGEPQAQPGELARDLLAQRLRVVPAAVDQHGE